MWATWCFSSTDEPGTPIPALNNVTFTQPKTCSTSRGTQTSRSYVYHKNAGNKNTFKPFCAH